jgi:NAD+ kinase
MSPGPILAIIGLALLAAAELIRRRSGLPAGVPVYIDTGKLETAAPLFDPELGLAGRPDYILKHRRAMIPVEVKTGSTPPQPYEGHTLQLAAYMKLVEAWNGHSPGNARQDAYLDRFAPAAFAHVRGTLLGLRLPICMRPGASRLRREGERALIISMMIGPNNPPGRILIAGHPNMPRSLEMAAELAAYLDSLGVENTHGSLYDEGLRSDVHAGRADVLIALGGDGTMLRAGHLCAPFKVPILGINLGGLGFLIEIQREGWKEALTMLLEGKFWLETRMMLHATHMRGDDELGTWDVLNECVIGRGEMVRPVRLTAVLDGHLLTTYVADALIVSTPTGSTAYALAAGGPILPPELRNILLVPVAPHLSVDRAIVLHEGSEVRITVRTDHQASLSMDGQEPVQMQDQDAIIVRASEDVVHFVRYQEPDYFYRNLTSRMNQNPSAGGHR